MVWEIPDYELHEKGEYAYFWLRKNRGAKHMDEATKFSETVTNTSNRILEILNAEGKTSSWDIKLKLHLSSSELYIALGQLSARDKIQLYPKDLTYAVAPSPEKQCQENA